MGFGVVLLPKPTSQGCCEGDGLAGAGTLCQLSSALQVSLITVINYFDNNNDGKTASELGIVWLCLVLVPGG